MRRIAKGAGMVVAMLAGCGPDPEAVLFEPGSGAIVYSADDRPVVILDGFGADDLGPIPPGTRVRVLADSASPKARDGTRTALDDPARDVVVQILEGEARGETVLLRRSDVRPAAP